MNTLDYIQEGERQLTNNNRYEMLDSEPTDRLNKYINHLIDQAWRLNSIKKDKTNNIITKI